MELTSGRLLARNTLINLVSEIAPFAVAVFAVPALIHGVGVDRYGVLTLSMMVVGYFGLFDFGLGRAATKLIAEAAAGGEQENIPGLFWTSLALMFAFGAIGGIVIAALAPWLAHTALKIPAAFQSESLRAFYLLALSMPFVVSGGSLSGALSAFQRFDLINAVRVPTGIFSYMGPLVVMEASNSLAWMIAVIVLVRVGGWVASFLLCLRVVPTLRYKVQLRRHTIRPMLSFGGWVTVSALVGPVMVYFDRFLIGAKLSMAAVSYYAVPFQVTSKLAILPSAASGVVFAAFSGSFSIDPARTAIIFERATRYVLLALFPPVLLVVAFAPEGLSFWLGPSFAAHSAPALRWLAVATFVNCLAWTPYGLVQAAHRPDLTAKFHLAEAPFYVAILWWMLPRYGIEGAAIAYILRVAADAVLLFAAVRKLAPLMAVAVSRTAILTVTALALIDASVRLPTGLPSKCFFVSTTLMAFVAATWMLLLQPEEKVFVRSWIHPFRVAAAGE